MVKGRQAASTLIEWGLTEGCCAVSRGDVARILGEPRSGRVIERTIANLVTDGVMERVARDVYLIRLVGKVADVNPLEQIVLAASRPYLAVESLETAASYWGMISQRYARGLSCVTTGRSRQLACSFGEVTFVHTQLSPTHLIDGSLDRGEGRLRLTDQELTEYLLNRTGRVKRLYVEYHSG